MVFESVTATKIDQMKTAKMARNTGIYNYELYLNYIRHQKRIFLKFQIYNFRKSHFNGSINEGQSKASLMGSMTVIESNERGNKNLLRITKYNYHE